MSNSDAGSFDASGAHLQTLRTAVELRTRGKVHLSMDVVRHMGPDEIQLLFYELRVHQIELEMQNDELIRSKAELESARARYFDLYDLAPVGYCSVNGQGHIVQCNLTLADLLGVPRNALMSQPFSRYICRNDQDDFYLACTRPPPETGPQPTQPPDLAFDRALQLVRADGSLLWVQLRAVEEPPGESDPLPGRPGLRIAVADITQRKQDESALGYQKQQLHDANQNLELRVVKRTQELEYARSMAEAALRSRGEFLAKMSHEIRTPINAITGMAHLIRREPLSPLQSERLGKLEHAGVHLLGVINDILDISKIDAAKLELETLPLQLDSLVASVLGMAEARAQERQIELRSEMPLLLPHLAGDATRLKQALLNYVGNAIKFTDAGSVTLRVLLQQESDTEALLLFEVADTGIGIAAPAMERLFMPFEQGDNATSRRYGGTGLGLAITRELAKLMGGEAGARSVPGAGSTFWFSARLAKQAGSAPASPPVGAPDALALLRRLHPGLRVLVAEDEPVNCEITTILLEDAGCVVAIAVDGLAALELAASNTYDLILMDMQMPGMDGLEATRSIRQLAAYRDVPIIAMTANAFEEDRRRCLAAGMNAFLSKPTPPALLYTAIVRALA